MTPIHWLGLAFVIYAFASLWWAPRRDDAINELWHLTLFAIAFILGSQLVDLRRFWKGLALGVGISSAIALVQWWWGAEWQILPTSDWGKPPGLFFNDAVAGAVAAIVFVGCLSERMWAWSVLSLPLLLLSQSRGAWLAVFATYFVVVWFALRWRERAIYLAAWSVPIAVAVAYYHTGSDPIRLEIWKALITHASWLGSGAGSTQSIFLFTSSNVFHIEHAHNDFIQLGYEYGLGTIPLVLALALLLEHRDAIPWPPLLCCTILSLYFWTLEAPVTAFAFGVVAGRVAADLGVAWDHGHVWGLAKLLRGVASELARGSGWRKDVPVLMGSSSAPSDEFREWADKQW